MVIDVGAMGSREGFGGHGWDWEEEGCPSDLLPLILGALLESVPCSCFVIITTMSFRGWPRILGCRWVSDSPLFPTATQSCAGTHRAGTNVFHTNPFGTACPLLELNFLLSQPSPPTTWFL